jgi:hypothetical protein
MRSFCIIILFAAVQLIGTARAQQANLYAGTDQQVYITGERIWIAGKLLDNGDVNEQELSIYLFNRNSKIVFKERIKTEDGKFHSNILLKGDTPTDNYVVALSMGGKFRLFIPVIVVNPVIAPEVKEFILTARKNEEIFKPLNMSTSVSSVNKRAEVLVKVDTPAKKLDYFISVARKDELSVYADSLFSGWQFSTDVVAPMNAGGDHIQARVSDSRGNGVEGTPVLASLLGNQAELGYGESGKEGKVDITIPYHRTDLPLLLMPLQDKEKKYKVTMEEDADNFNFSFELPPLALPQRFEPAISERVVSAEVYNKFRAEEKFAMMVLNMDTTDFYGKPDKTYILDNYTRFPDMQEILSEFIPEVRVKKTATGNFLQTNNAPYKVFFDQPALVMLDGVPVTDIDQLLTLDPLKIKSVDILTRKFLLGRLQINGIVHYKSYKSDLAGYRLASNELLYDHRGLGIPLAPAYTELKDQRMPDMRNTIYWRLPGRLPSGSFSFSTLDSEGDFQINVTAVDDQGAKFKGKVELAVK